MKFYTYLIGWSKLNLWYYGARVANKVSPEMDLWKKYFTSSYYVQQTRQQFGEPDVIEIRKTFNDSEKCYLWEQSVLRKMNIKNNKKWLNKAIGGKFPIDDDIKTKMSISHKGKKFSDIHKENISIKTKNYWSSEEGLLKKKRLQKRMETFVVSDLTKEKIRNSSLGRKLSLEAREKISKGLKNIIRKQNPIKFSYDNGIELIYKSMKDASRNTGLSISTLNKICSSEKGYGIESYSKKHKFKVERLIS